MKQFLELIDAVVSLLKVSVYSLVSVSLVLFFLFVVFPVLPNQTQFPLIALDSFLAFLFVLILLKFKFEKLFIVVSHFFS